MPESNEHPPRREHLEEEKLFQLIDGIGNIEAKLLTTALIILQPHAYFTRTTLARELVGRQGQHVQWKPSDRVGMGYCQKSLEPIGAVVKSTVKGRTGPIDAFKASEFGVEFGLPFASTLLDWSLTHPEISVQKVFGFTASTGEVRSPSTRFLIYQALLGSPHERLSYTDITEPLEAYNLKPSAVIGQLGALANLGIIDIQSKQKEYNPRIQIHSIEFPKRQIQLSTHFFFEVAEQLYAQGERVIALNDFLAACLSKDPDVDLTKLRHTFTVALQESRFSHITLIDKGPLGDSNTGVRLTDPYKEPVKELWERLESVREGTPAKEYRKVAAQIIDTPDTFSALMGKSKRFSSSVRGHDPNETPLPEKILEVLDNNKELSAQQVLERLGDRGVTYDVRSIRVALNGLVKDNRVLKNKTVLDASKKSATSTFYLPE